MSWSGYSIYVCQIIIVNVNKRLKPLYIDPYCQYWKNSHACLSIVQNVIICHLSINVQCHLKDFKHCVRLDADTHSVS